MFGNYGVKEVRPVRDENRATLPVVELPVDQ
jgi:hypothetical protein